MALIQYACGGVAALDVPGLHQALHYRNRMLTAHHQQNNLVNKFSPVAFQKHRGSCRQSFKFKVLSVMLSKQQPVSL
jgi:hypothetical protein